MPPFSVKDIDHIVLCVRDLQISMKFYVDVIGCMVTKINEEYSLIHLKAGLSMIDLASVDGMLGKAGGDAPDARRQNVDHLCLKIDPFHLDELRAYFAAHNIEVDQPLVRYGAEGDGLSIYIYDPDGNRVELKGPSQARSA